ncbi:MAG: AAA family ATPase [Micromonosporaceae bacterium]
MQGRREELAAIARAWRRVADRARPVVVTGEAGVGKSRLVAEAVAALAPAPARVLTGQARAHSPAPYDWTASALSGAALDDVPVPDDALGWICQRAEAPARRFAPGMLLRAAVDTVRAVLGERPGVLVVEDLHDLDPASLELISELATAPRMPALLLVTSRAPSEAAFPELAARVLARLSGTPRSVRRHLPPLTAGEVAAVLESGFGTPPPADAVSQALRRTGGNPYRLSELVAECRPYGWDGLRDAPAPGLTDREREVLGCVASGMTNQQIARSLSISVRTVGVHVSNLLRKTGSGSRTAAALWAVRHGLAEPAADRTAS